MRKIKNYCEFVIKGLNQERFFNELSKHSYVFDINRFERNKVCFKVPIKNAKKVKKLIIKSGYEILGQTKKGMVYQILNLRYAYGFLIALCVCFAGYFIQLNNLWLIDVNGVDSSLASEISEYISSNYSLKKNINCKQVEIDVRKNFQRLSFFSVIVEGQSLVINAKEGEIPSEKTEDFQPIISQYDCKIKEIKLIQGTLAVEVGDVVQVGEVIVYPYIIDTNGEQKKVQPKVELKIETWLTGDYTHFDQEYVCQRTGKIFVQQEIKLFGVTIYSSSNPCEFECYETCENEKYLSKNNIFPFILKKTTYFETNYVLVEEIYENVREQKISLARNNALQKFEECDIITNERYVENRMAGVCHLKYYLTIEKELEFK